MILGEIPGLALDRTGIALLGAIALVVAGRASPDGALELVDVPTLSLLFGLMVVSAQFRLGGFYSHVTRLLAALDAKPPVLLFWLIAVAGVLSPVLALSSTLAGNLFVVGSIANIIVLDQARRLGVEIGWRQHARAGVPVTLATLALTWVWLAL